MRMPMGARGDPTLGLDAAAFTLMWATMMAAMMLPSVAPMAGVWAAAIARAPSAAGRAGRLAGFVAGYLLAWSASGVLAWGVCVAAGALIALRPALAPWLAAGIWLAAGAWQLAPWKDACLRHCRSPFASLAHYAAWSGPARDLRVGLHHGLYCLGCCGGLMLVLVATGVMNLPAMVALTAVVFLEKVWRHGFVLARALAVGFLLAGLAAPFAPALWPGLVSPGAP